MKLEIAEFFHCLILIPIIKSDVSFHNNSVGYICVLLLGAIFLVESKSNCDISKDGLIANCSGRVDNIPNDLNPMISALDLSSNTFIELRENSFKKYKNLVKLLLKFIILDISKVDLYLFRPLKKLRVLDLSESDFTERAYFYFPESLVVLNINQLQVKDVDLSHNKNLREFHAQNNKLLELPVIHVLAPLTIIDLDFNILATLTPERLAPFCLIQTMHVELDPTARLISSPSRYCICTLVNLWTQSFKILGDKLPCNASRYKFECDETFSEETLLLYRTCSERNKKITSMKLFLIAAGIATLLVAASGLGYLVFLYYSNKSKSLASGSSYDQTEIATDSYIRGDSSKIEPDEIEY